MLNAFISLMLLAASRCRRLAARPDSMPMPVALRCDQWGLKTERALVAVFAARARRDEPI